MSRWFPVILAILAILSVVAVGCGVGDDPVVGGGAAQESEDAPAADAGQDGGAGSAVELDAGAIIVNDERYEFGIDYGVLGPVLEAVLGPPTSDSGTVPTDGGCPTNSDTYRFVDFDGLSLTILDASAYADGYAHLAQWIAFEEAEPAMPIAHVGDAPGIVIDPGTTTVEDLVTAFGEEITIEDEPPLGAQFVLEDGAGRLIGALSGTTAEDVVFSVLAGEGCGE